MNFKINYILPILSALIIGGFIIGCSSGNNSDSAGGKGIKLNSQATSPKLTDYEKVKSIDLYVKNDPSDDFEILVDGAYVPAGFQTVGVKLNYAAGSGNENVDLIVYVSDGGMMEKTETFLDASTGYYVCEFEFTTAYLISSIFIQVIYPDGFESTKKVVVNTTKDVRPDEDSLVSNGMGITIGSDILEGFHGTVEGMLKDISNLKVEVENLSPADNSEGSANGVIHLSLKNLLYGDIILTSGSDDERGLTIEFEDLSLLWDSSFGKTMGYFIDPWLNFSLGALGFDMGMLLGMMGGSEDSSNNALGNIISDLELEKTLLLDIYGLPDSTTPDFAAIGGGIFTYNTKELDTDEDGKLLWPNVYVDDNLSTPKLKRILDESDYNINVMLSQYNLNQMITGITDGMEVVMDETVVDLSFLKTENQSTKMALAVTPNPKGIAIDFNYETKPPVALINICDLKIVLFEDGEEAVRLSVDTIVKATFDIQSNGEGYSLVVTAEPLLELSHINIMEDHKGLSILDHANILIALFNAVKDPNSDGFIVQLPINLSDLGIRFNKDISKAGKVEFDGNGNCFLSLAVDSIDPSQILGDDVCFISTAFFK